MDKKWEDAVIRAAAEASHLQPLATGLFVIALMFTVGAGFAEPMFEALRHSGEERAELFRETSRNVFAALPAIILLWALWDARAYLGRLARGDVWGPATMRMLGNVGAALLWAGIVATAVSPTLERWVYGDFGFDVRVEPTFIALIGLGLILSLIGRVVRNVVDVATALKRENDEIV